MNTSRLIIFLPSLILSVSCSQPARVVKTETKEYAMSDSATTGIDSVVERVIRPYRDSMSAAMNGVIAHADVALEKGQPEGLLGNFFSDACLQVGRSTYYPEDGKNIDFAFFNNGGLRAALPKGNITRGNVFELMPFENELVVVTLDGARANKIFNFIAAKDGVPVSGVRMEINNKEPARVTINGEPFDSTKVYKALTSDYLANGGDQYFFLVDAKKESLNLKIRDAVIQYLQGITREGKTVNANLDQRISYVK